MRARIIKVDAVGDAAAVADAAGVLAAGGLVVIPTDTVYGVAACVDRPEAIERIYAAKVRDSGKPIPLLAADVEAVEAVAGSLSVGERKLAERFWPGALTLVVEVGEGTEGIRVPDCTLTRQILAAVGGMLRVTSANRSGEPPALTAQEAYEVLGDSVELIVDAGESTGGVASSVVRVENGQVKIFREGALSESVLRESAGN
ncbi:MAG: threonylcarbamoyl-AMP synthase [Kiritimatiellae bacterium]|nr:threonylcarbamoyl-AMP synthase [Kiritimatiellia bacterium]